MAFSGQPGVAGVESGCHREGTAILQYLAAQSKDLMALFSVFLTGPPVRLQAPHSNQMLQCYSSLNSFIPSFIN